MEEQEAITIRFPARLLAQVRLHKLKGDLNNMIVKALKREVRYRQSLVAHHRIAARREQIRKKSGTQPDSVDLIRQLREGEAFG